jgi:hypothetical protein
VTIVGIQAFVVFVGVAIALLVGVIVGMLDVAGPLAGWLAVGLLPVVWTLLYLIERATGRGIWHYSTPYPYRRMAVAPVTRASRPQTAPQRELMGQDAEEIQLAA